MKCTQTSGLFGLFSNLDIVEYNFFSGRKGTLSMMKKGFLKGIAAIGRGSDGNWAIAVKYQDCSEYMYDRHHGGLGEWHLYPKMWMNKIFDKISLVTVFFTSIQNKNFFC